jgi:hypothetical protein
MADDRERRHGSDSDELGRATDGDVVDTGEDQMLEDDDFEENDEEEDEAE